MKEKQQISKSKKGTWIGMKSSSEIELEEDKTKKKDKNKGWKLRWMIKKHHNESLFLSHV